GCFKAKGSSSRAPTLWEAPRATISDLTRTAAAASLSACSSKIYRFHHTLIQGCFDTLKPKKWLRTFPVTAELL
ncbi:hypothetical protein KAU04_06630, partial [bacterium]|nr:hypothetical protein [bacterium]